MELPFRLEDRERGDSLHDADDERYKAHEPREPLALLMIREPLHKLFRQLQRIQLAFAAHIKQTGDDAEDAQYGVKEARQEKREMMFFAFFHKLLPP